MSGHQSASRPNRQSQSRLKLPPEDLKPTGTNGGLNAKGVSSDSNNRHFNDNKAESGESATVAATGGGAYGSSQTQAHSQSIARNGHTNSRTALPVRVNELALPPNSHYDGGSFEHPQSLSDRRFETSSLSHKPPPASSSQSHHGRPASAFPSSQPSQHGHTINFGSTQNSPPGSHHNMPPFRGYPVRKPVTRPSGSPPPAGHMQRSASSSKIDVHGHSNGWTSSSPGNPVIGSTNSLFRQTIADMIQGVSTYPLEDVEYDDDGLVSVEPQQQQSGRDSDQQQQQMRPNNLEVFSRPQSRPLQSSASSSNIIRSPPPPRHSFDSRESAGSPTSPHVHSRSKSQSVSSPPPQPFLNFATPSRQTINDSRRKPHSFSSATLPRPLSAAQLQRPPASDAMFDAKSHEMVSSAAAAAAMAAAQAASWAEAKTKTRPPSAPSRSMAPQRWSSSSQKSLTQVLNGDSSKGSNPASPNLSRPVSANRSRPSSQNSSARRGKPASNPSLSMRNQSFDGGDRSDSSDSQSGSNDRRLLARAASAKQLRFHDGGRQSSHNPELDEILVPYSEIRRGAKPRPSTAQSPPHPKVFPRAVTDPIDFYPRASAAVDMAMVQRVQEEREAQFFSNSASEDPYAQSTGEASQRHIRSTSNPTATAKSPVPDVDADEAQFTNVGVHHDHDLPRHVKRASVGESVTAAMSDPDEAFRSPKASQPATRTYSVHDAVSPPTAATQSALLSSVANLPSPMRPLGVGRIPSGAHMASVAAAMAMERDVDELSSQREGQSQSPASFNHSPALSNSLAQYAGQDTSSPETQTTHLQINQPASSPSASQQTNPTTHSQVPKRPHSAHSDSSDDDSDPKNPRDHHRLMPPNPSLRPASSTSTLRPSSSASTHSKSASNLFVVSPSSQSQFRSPIVDLETQLLERLQHLEFTYRHMPSQSNAGAGQPRKNSKEKPGELQDPALIKGTNLRTDDNYDAAAIAKARATVSDLADRGAFYNPPPPAARSPAPKPDDSDSDDDAVFVDDSEKSEVEKHLLWEEHRLHVFRDIFGQIITQDTSYGPLLKRIKDEYDQFCFGERNTVVDLPRLSSDPGVEPAKMTFPYAQKSALALRVENQQLHTRLERFQLDFARVAEEKERQAQLASDMRKKLTQRERAMRALIEKLATLGVYVDMSDDGEIERYLHGPPLQLPKEDDGSYKAPSTATNPMGTRDEQTRKPDGYAAVPSTLLRSFSIPQLSQGAAALSGEGVGPISAPNSGRRSLATLSVPDQSNRRGAASVPVSPNNLAAPTIGTASLTPSAKRPGQSHQAFQFSPTAIKHFERAASHHTPHHPHNNSGSHASAQPPPQPAGGHANRIPIPIPALPLEAIASQDSQPELHSPSSPDSSASERADSLASEQSRLTATRENYQDQSHQHHQHQAYASQNRNPRDSGSSTDSDTWEVSDDDRSLPRGPAAVSNDFDSSPSPRPKPRPSSSKHGVRSPPSGYHSSDTNATDDYTDIASSPEFYRQYESKRPEFVPPLSLQQLTEDHDEVAVQKEYWAQKDKEDAEAIEKQWDNYDDKKSNRKQQTVVPVRADEVDSYEYQYLMEQQKHHQHQPPAHHHPSVPQQQQPFKSPQPFKPVQHQPYKSPQPARDAQAYGHARVASFDSSVFASDTESKYTDGTDGPHSPPFNSYEVPPMSYSHSESKSRLQFNSPPESHLSPLTGPQRPQKMSVVNDSAGGEEPHLLDAAFALSQSQFRANEPASLGLPRVGSQNKSGSRNVSPAPR